MIKVRCHTNLDDYKMVDWPTFMVCPPNIGDFVEGRRGEHGAGSRPKLRVVAITHSMFDPQNALAGFKPELLPILLVELHK